MQIWWMPSQLSCFLWHWHWLFLFSGSVLFYMPHLLHTELRLWIILILFMRKLYKDQGRLKNHSGRKLTKKQKFKFATTSFLPDIYNLGLKTKLISSLSFWFLSSPGSSQWSRVVAVLVVALITLSAPPSRHWITELRPAILTLEVRLELSGRPG